MVKLKADQISFITSPRSMIQHTKPALTVRGKSDFILFDALGPFVAGGSGYAKGEA